MVYITTRWVLRIVASGALLVASGLAEGCSDSSDDDGAQSEEDELPAGSGPCDIYASGNAPCVAAHSTVRRLLRSYDGPLYQVHRDDNSTLEVTINAGGFADSEAQDKFCSGHTCRISKIYDQSGTGNTLGVPSYTYWSHHDNKKTEGALANAAPITVSGHHVYGVSVAAGEGVAYRNVPGSKGAATGNGAESMYAVLDGRQSSSACCFDYGNGETSGNDDGEGTMEAIYWGKDTHWGGLGAGEGPWIAADLEQGMYKCDVGGPSANCSESTPAITYDFVTAMLKGPDTDAFELKAGNAQGGVLARHWDGKRPSHRPQDTNPKPYGPLVNGKPSKIQQEYFPKHLEGGIILGTGGDGSFGGAGIFYEGAMTEKVTSAAIDNLVQKNIVAVGYGR